MSEAKNSVHPLVRPVWMDWINRRVAKNLDKWGVQDFETLGLAVAEEAGELAQAILQARDEGGERGRISQEAIDLAALCVQVLVTMKEKHGAENVWNALFADGSNAGGQRAGDSRYAEPPCSVEG
jgi:NTP pyrophosphatase (non-canonical NTP hydrolase)